MVLLMAITYKKIDDKLVLMHRIHGKVNDLPEVLRNLKESAGHAVNGDPVVVHHYPLTNEKGRTMDVCLPISKRIENNEFQIYVLEGGLAATAVHIGPYEKITETYRPLITEVYEHGHPIQENGREVFVNLDFKNPENTVVEIVAMLIDFEGKLDENLRRVIGSEKTDYVLCGFAELRPNLDQEERSKLIRDALLRLDEIATEQQKFEALSRCGHQFPAELIQVMRELYQETKSIDSVIQAMSEGHHFYPKLRREGNIIYDRKGPARKEAFEKATTKQERNRAICFCPLLKDVWEEMPETFCYCAAGWPRRLFEGILGTSVKVDVVKSLTNGDDYCEFAIRLPAGTT